MICIISAIWNRWKMTDIFLDSLRRYWNNYGIISVVAGSEGVKSRERCLDYGVHYIEVPNKPLCNKFIEASRTAFSLPEVSYILVMGSDDFMEDKAMANYIGYAHQGLDYVGIKDCYYYDVTTRRGAYYGGHTANHRKGEPIGMGRMVSRIVYDKAHGLLWNRNIPIGCDWIMSQRLKKFNLKKKVLSVKDIGVVVDFKTKYNINSYEAYAQNLVGIPDETFEVIPEFKHIINESEG